MGTADLGYPVLVGILLFWLLFAVFSMLATFLSRDGIRDLRRFFHRMMETSEESKNHEG